MKWIVLAITSLLPIVAMILGMIIINILLILFLFLIWIFYPLFGALLYLACCINLIIWKTIIRKKDSLQMVKNNQNSSSTILMLLGFIGAVRSFIAHDILGVIIGILCGIILFILQGSLFNSNNDNNNVINFKFQKLDDIT